MSDDLRVELVGKALDRYPHFTAVRSINPNEDVQVEGVVRAHTRLRTGDFVPQHFTLDDVVLVSSIAPVSFHPRTLLLAVSLGRQGEPARLVWSPANDVIDLDPIAAGLQLERPAPMPCPASLP